MRITPIDIQQQQFKSRLMGYDKAGVDHFLELLAGELERLLRQNQDLQEEMARTKSALAEMRDREATLKETLLTTQKITDALKTNARHEADLLLADTELRAARLMQDAEERRLQLLKEVQEIKRQKIAFETGLRCMLEQHVRLLDLNVLPVREEKGEGKLLEESLAHGATDQAPGSPVPAKATAPDSDEVEEAD